MAEASSARLASAELVASLSHELLSKGLTKLEAVKFAKTLVESFGAGHWDDVLRMDQDLFDEALRVAKLLPVSVLKLTDVRLEFSHDLKS